MDVFSLLTYLLLSNLACVHVLVPLTGSVPQCRDFLR